MKNTIKILFILFLFASCQQKIEPSDIAKINGYWEIKKVVFPDGNHKDYGINETYDYFEIKNNKGFRKKVTPQLDGKFLVNDLSENVEVLFDHDKTYLSYNTTYAKWKEQLKSISDSEMVVINKEEKEYHYKKTGPINLLGNGEKTK